MDRISGLNATQVAKELQGYKRYSRKTQKEIKNKVGNVSALRDELRRLDNKKNKPIIKPVLKDILLPPYLAQLDYTDLRNLCRTNKEYNICDDDMVIKNILAITMPNVVFKMNVAKLLKSLDDQIEKLINIHYFDLPRWVNHELFMIDMKKKIYYNLAERLNDTLDANCDANGKFDKEMFSKDGSLKIKLSKSFLAFALVSNEFEEPDYDDDVELDENEIVLSKRFVKYLMTALGVYENYRQAQPIIKNVLFIRK